MDYSNGPTFPWAVPSKILIKWRKNPGMPPTISLPPRRYTILDSIWVAFHCAPAVAFFYGFFDLTNAVLTPVITVVAAGLIDAVINSAQEGTPIREVYIYLALLAGLSAFKWLASSLHNFADLWLVLALRARYRTALPEKRTRLEYALIEQSDTWDLIQRVAANPEGGRLKATYYHLINITSFIIKVGGLLIILASIVWWAPLVVVVTAGFALVIGVRGGKTLYHAERQVAEYDRRLDYLREVMLGREAAAERTLFGSSGMLAEMWHRAFSSALSVRFRARLKWYINAYIGNLTNLAIWILLMLVLLPSLQSGAVSIGLFIALTQAFTQFDIVWGFMDTVNGLAADGEFFKDLSAFLALPEEIQDSGSVTIEPIPSSYLIEFQDVRFRYPGTNRFILDGVNLTLEEGKHYALVGVNGCGKTTITRLVTGLYPVESGRILVNGRNIQKYPATELRSLFSIVYQDFARYGVTLHENVFLGYDHPINGRVFERAGLDPLINRLPQGVNTPLGKIVPAGVDISGGEWQRVAMARSLARPSVLRILDEPTAALDPIAESELYASFGRLTEGATTLLITHRLGATKTADVIMVLDGGRIVETGPHAALMQAGGLYARMYESQRYWYETN